MFPFQPLGITHRLALGEGKQYLLYPFRRAV